MTHRMPQRFGAHASWIQLLAWIAAGAYLDAGVTRGACVLASMLFWIGAALLLCRHSGRVSRFELYFLRSGLLAFVLIFAPLLRPVFTGRDWLVSWLGPIEAVLLVGPLIYLVTRLFRLRSPFDDMLSPSVEE